MSNIDNRVGQVQIIPFRFSRSDDQLEVLLLQRNPQKGGFWQPVTGGREPDETIHQAAERELHEELGITFDDCSAVIDDNYEFQFSDKHQGKTRTFTENVLAVILHNDAVIIRSSEHVDERWLTPVDAVALLKYDTNKASVGHYATLIASRYLPHD